MQDMIQDRGLATRIGHSVRAWWNVVVHVRSIPHPRMSEITNEPTMSIPAEPHDEPPPIVQRWTPVRSHLRADAAARAPYTSSARVPLNPGATRVRIEVEES